MKNDMMWIQLKNIVVIISMCLGIYYISPWMALVGLFYTMIDEGE